MLGAGLRAAGDAVDTGGTSGGIGIYADRPVEVPRAFLAPAPLPGLWVVGGAMAALGASVDWMRSAVLGDRWTPDELFLAAAGVAPGADGLVFLPYLAGERAPIFDEEARGVLFGLTLAHGPEHLARAALEGAAFALRHVAEPLAAAGAPVRELRLAGRPSAGRCLGPDQGRRPGRAGRDPHRRRDGRPGGGDPGRGRRGRRSRRSRPGWRR